MEQQLLAQALLTLLMSAITAVAGYLGGKLKEQRALQDSRKEHDRLMEAGMVAVLRRDLVDAYQNHVTEGHTLTVERKRELDDEYEIYAALGGNGTGKQMYESVCRSCDVTMVD